LQNYRTYFKETGSTHASQRVTQPIYTTVDHYGSSSHCYHCSCANLHVGLLCVSDCVTKKIASNIQKFTNYISNSQSFPELTNSPRFPCFPEL